MSFAHPEYLLLTALLPGLHWLVGRGRIRGWRQLARWTSSTRVASSPLPWSVLALGLLAVALAQPRWGRLENPVPPGHDVILVVDVSRSMAAEDAIPDRLAVAVESAADLVRQLAATPGSRVGLVAFSGRAVVRAALTEYHAAVVDALQELRAGELLPGGTDFGAALSLALDAFDEEDVAGGRAVVLFSDGEDHNGSWPAILDRYKERGIAVHTVALGDASLGAPLRDDRGAMIRDGEPVVSKRDDATLKQIAEASGGAFLPVGIRSLADFGTLYRDRITPAARLRHDATATPERPERFGPFVAAAAGILVWASWPRRTSRRPGWAGALLVPLLLGSAANEDSPAEPIARGREQFKAGAFAEALDAFEDAARIASSSALVRYDIAATLYRLERFEDADTQYEAAAELADEPLRAKIDYARGNTALSLGRIDAAIRHYDRCIASRVPGPFFDRLRADAEINRRFAEEHRTPEADSPSPSGERPTDAEGDRPKESPPPDDEPRPERRTQNATGGRSRPSAQRRTAPSGSAEERLQQALDHVENARGDRPRDPVPNAASDLGKDW